MTKQLLWRLAVKRYEAAYATYNTAIVRYDGDAPERIAAAKEWDEARQALDDMIPA